MEEQRKQGTYKGIMDEYRAGGRKTNVPNRPTHPIDDLRVFDTATGEIIQGYDIRRTTTDAQRIGHNARKTNEEIDRLGFYWAIIHDGGDHMAKLSDAEMGRFIYLMTFASYDSGDESGGIVLQFDNGRRMTRKHIEETMKLGASAFKSFMASIRKHDFITPISKEDGGGFRVNTEHFYRGTGIAKKVNDGQRFTRIFRENVRNIYLAMEPKQHRYLGMIYKLLPHIHYSQNVLVYNPTETNYTELNALMMSTIAEILGYENVKDARQLLRKIVIDDRPLFKYTQSNDGKDEFVMVNPFVVYGGGDVELAVLRTIFSI